MKKQSLVGGFRMTVTWIAVASIVATLITWFLAAALYLMEQNRGIYPANYYELQIPAIDQYVRRENTKLLSQTNEMGLKNAIEGDGISYQVVDNRAAVLYGTNTEPIFSSEADLINHLNTTEVYLDKNTYLHVIPLTDEDGKMVGAVALIYEVKISVAGNGGQWVLGIIIVALFSPVLYIILFTKFFSKKFIKRINQPLQLLMEAAKKIKDKDLDFRIHYYADNELGELCIAFSEMQEELKTSLSTQWEMERERMEMVEALTHDLKTPISIILAYTESLLDTKQTNPERCRRYLSVIEGNAQKCRNFVSQMQIASESEQAGNELNPTEVDLYDFLSQKAKHYELQAKAKAVSIELCDDASIHATYSIDTDKLDRIFDNIVSNSLRYTPANGKILISAFADQRTITYRVCDTGCGFSKKDLERATQRFYRGDEARQSGEGHSGLGLYTVKQLVHQLGGSVDLSNRKDGGACVQFSQQIF